jgi:hypothetical protein
VTRKARNAGNGPPVYAAGGYLRPAVEVLAQTCQNWELILVDDGSTTAAWHDSTTFTTVSRVASERGQAGDEPRTRLAGEFMRWDADDRSHPLRLERQCVPVGDPSLAKLGPVMTAGWPRLQTTIPRIALGYRAGWMPARSGGRIAYRSSATFIREICRSLRADCLGRAVSLMVLEYLISGSSESVTEGSVAQFAGKSMIACGARGHQVVSDRAETKLAWEADNNLVSHLPPALRPVLAGGGWGTRTGLAGPEPAADAEAPRAAAKTLIVVHPSGA